MHRHHTGYHDLGDEAVARLRSRLLAWYDGPDRVRREMPWRKDRPDDFTSWTETAQRDWLAQRAYEVWVSEIMLQQTQVQTVVAYYTKWMQAWPTVHDLAMAEPEVQYAHMHKTRLLTALQWPPQAVQKTWSGLGYYSRARRLQEAAKLVVEKFDGVLPSDAAVLKNSIPGIGPYTAGAVIVQVKLQLLALIRGRTVIIFQGAISSIVFHKPAPLVDGNVVRVLSRLRAIGADAKAPATIALHWKLAQRLVDPDRPGDLNQALMDFGATVCTPTAPSCESCPISDDCHAYREQLANSSLLADRLISSPRGLTTPAPDIEDTCTFCSPNPSMAELQALKVPYVTLYPRKEKKKAIREETVAVCAIVCREPQLSIYLVQRPASGLLANMWELPSVIVSENDGGDEEDDNRQPPDKTVTSALDELVHLMVGATKTVGQRRPLGTSTHVFSHLKHHYQVELLELAQLSPVSQRCKWATVDEIKGEAVSTGMKRVLQQLVYPALDAASAPKGSRKRKELLPSEPAKQARTIPNYFARSTA